MTKKLKLFIIILSLVLLTTSGKLMNDEISYTSLTFATKIIGSLGKPLGEIITIEGKVLPDDFRNLKSDMGKIILKVEKVNKKKIKKPIIIPFKKFGWIEAEDPKPGKKFKYIGYETGGFEGIPHEAFEHMPYATTTDYHFEVYFMACKELK